MIPKWRYAFNERYKPDAYRNLLVNLNRRCATEVQFRVAETPVFLPKSLLDAMAESGARLTRRLLAWPEYQEAARASIPSHFLVAGASSHPNFLTADFALIEDSDGQLQPRLVELQAFPSVFAYQAILTQEYDRAYRIFQQSGQLGELSVFFGGLEEEAFWALLRRTVLGNHPPQNVVLTEVDPQHQKTLPDFNLTAGRLGITVVDIASLVPKGDRLHYRNTAGELIPIHRIYNRAIADEMMARQIQLPFDLTYPWDVEWAGHPNWYFLVSKFSVPWLSRPGGPPSEKSPGANPAAAMQAQPDPVVPPAVFLDEFLDGPGHRFLEAAGVHLPAATGPETVYDDLILKPLFSFAGKGIQFAPNREELQSIPKLEQKKYLLQQRMHFLPTIATPHGMTQAEIRILYLWPDGGDLTPVLPLIRLGRGKMMGVDHNRNQEWVGASAAFWQ